jgi:hypothetical protein
VYNAGLLVLTPCTLSSNGIGTFFPANAGIMMWTNSGGGVYNNAALTLINCTLFGNVANAGINWGGMGGGIYNAGMLALTACTLSSNSAFGGLDMSPIGTGGHGGPGAGGGVYNAGSISVCNTIIADNNVVGGVSLSSFTVTGSATGPDVLGGVSSLGYNLIGETDNSSGWVPNDLTGTLAVPLDPGLGPLADNGGPTFTMALLPGSPAIEVGDDALLGPPYNLTTDQRGFPRKSGAHVDIGAFEFQSATLTPPALIVLPQYRAGGFQFAFTSTPGTAFSVLTATNLALPLSNWTVLGQASETTPGQFQFADPQTTDNSKRFYRVRSP